MRDYLAPPPNLDDPDAVALYDEAALWSTRFGMVLLDLLPLAPELAILDVGCGTGFPTCELAQIFGDTCQVTGVDVWDAALDRARRKQQFYQLDNLRFLHADAAALPFADHSFDLIVSNLGINNFESPQRVLAECFRVAKPGAQLFLTTNVVGHMREFYVVYRDVLSALGQASALQRLDQQEAHRGTRDSVCALLREAGFTVTAVVEDSFPLRYLDGSAFLRHYFVRLGFLPGWRGVLDPADVAAVFAALEDRLNDTAREHDDLRLTVPMLLVKARRDVTP